MLEENLKVAFKRGFYKKLEEIPTLKLFLFEVFVYGSAYVVGGYLRDFIKNEISRDIDIIIDLSHDKLLKIINATQLKYSVNRYSGIKLHFNEVDVDIWSIEKNWAFKDKLVKLNDDDKLHSIAKGCFYNYDSLVINLHNFSYNLQYYNNFIINNELDILQQSSEYKILNPTIEANVLRAFFIRKSFNSTYSSNTKKYLLTKIGEMKDSGLDPLSHLLEVRDQYPKYKHSLNSNDIKGYIDELYIDNKLGEQFYLKF